MSEVFDREFHPPIEKTWASHEADEPPNSRLAVVSLVFGILGLTALPVVGSIVAVATGHAAMGQIRESGGRLKGTSLASVGLRLGYLMFFLAIVAVGIVFTYLVRFSVEDPVAVRTTAPVSDPVRGVKMVNEMQREDYRLIEESKVEVQEGEIIACYNAGMPRNDPAFALLTTRQIVYLKEGRTTVFDLKDVVNIKDDSAYENAYNVEKQPNGISLNRFDYEIYHIEIRSRQGPRMRIEIQPTKDGSIFYDALKTALEGAGLTLSPGGGF